MNVSRSIRSLLSAVVLASLAACGPRGDAAATADAGQTDAQLMEKGTQLLYQSGDPVAAEGVFRQVISRTPTHYGAHYQLAVAMDRGGKPSEARAEWTEVVKMAEAIKDSSTLQAARSRLAMPDTASQSGLMARGVHLMYQQNKPAEAVDQFRAVLALNPTHYGATYQLAVALDRIGRAPEARPVWERVLPMAIQFKDQRTIDTARARLR